MKAVSSNLEEVEAKVATSFPLAMTPWSMVGRKPNDGV
jgi:hypothetical protein